MGGQFSAAKDSEDPTTLQKVLGTIGGGLQGAGQAVQQQPGAEAPLPQVMMPTPVQIPQVNPAIYGAPVPGMPEYRKFNAFRPRPSNAV
jgi:hypothetical protein